MFKKIFLFSVIIGVLLIPTLVVHAQYGIDITAEQTPIAQFKNLSIPTMVGRILGSVLAMVGIVFFALMLYGGITWMTAAGNQEKEKKAMSTMVSAAIGVVIVLSSYVLVSFVLDKSGLVGESPVGAIPSAGVTDCIAAQGTTSEGIASDCAGQTPEDCLEINEIFSLDVCKVENNKCVLNTEKYSDINLYCLQFNGKQQQCEENLLCQPK